MESVVARNYRQVTTGGKIKMYCVIQEIERKKPDVNGEPLEIKPYESSFTIGGQPNVTYGYSMSEERCQRPIRTAYKISIHRSYRENGKVKKQQVAICTMGYYDIADTTSWVGDYMTAHEWEEKQKQLGISEKELVKIIYAKLDPLIEQIQREFQQSEEGRLKKEHEKITKAYREAQEAFAREYECDRGEFQHCYDIFLKLRNPEYLKKVQAEHEARKEYERRSRENSRGYYEKFRDNYSSGSSGFSFNVREEANQDILKQFYRVLSKKFHPDANPDIDTSEQMKVLNQLKQEWGV